MSEPRKQWRKNDLAADLLAVTGADGAKCTVKVDERTRLGFAAVDPWISTLDELPRRPLGPDSLGGLRPHHLDLRVSRDFCDDDTHEGVWRAGDLSRTRPAKS